MTQDFLQARGDRFNFPFKHVTGPGAFSPDGKWFAHLVRDGVGDNTSCHLAIRDLSADEGHATAKLPDSAHWMALAFQDNSTFVLIGTNRCLAWQFGPGGKLRLTHSHKWGPFEFRCAALSRDGRVVAGTGTVPGHSYRARAGHLLRLPDAQFIGRIPDLSKSRWIGSYLDFSLSPDGTHFFSESASGKLNVWRLKTHQLERLSHDAP